MEVTCAFSNIPSSDQSVRLTMRRCEHDSPPQALSHHSRAQRFAFTTPPPRLTREGA